MAGATDARPRALPRRRVLTGALAGAGLLGAGLASPRLPELLRKDDPVRSVTVAFTSAMERSALSAEAARALPPHTRVLPGPTTAPAADREEDFLATCAPWLASVPARFGDLARSALLDLFVLSDGLPAPVASWAGVWRFIWPRDTAFAAAALARIGHVGLAWRQLAHLSGLQEPDGWFAARYDPLTGTVPDARPAQLDSVGLVAWSVAEVLAAGPAPDRLSPADLTPLLDRTAALLLDLTANGCRLPPVSPDYWEVAEARVTLGIAAPTLIGLRSLAVLDGAGAWHHLGGSGILTEAAEEFTATFRRTFSAGGFQRYPSSGGLDSAAAYLPAAGGGDLLDAAGLDRVRERLTQPAGGIRPGHGWILDEASWTPSTSLLGLGYARLGEHARAAEVLDWLSDHRSPAGSLPEKVAADGLAVSVAPLVWTAANVVLTLDALRTGTAGPH